MKVIVLGGTGMLGHVVFEYLFSKYKDDVIFSSRGSALDSSFHFDALLSDYNSIPDCDYIINCIGIVKPLISKSVENAIIINSLFPILLAKYCKQKNIRLIHITTDCVFSGQKGKYVEDSFHDALDIYGKTKSLGESCQNESMVIRTSIIGEEIKSCLNLIEWVKSQKGKQVNGYTNHLWNGVTTLQYAKICDQIIEKDLYKEGLYHVFSDIVSKYDLVSMINEYFGLNITVKPFEAGVSCDRTMLTNKKLNSILNIPIIKKQIWEM